MSLKGKAFHGLRVQNSCCIECYDQQGKIITNYAYLSRSLLLLKTVNG